MSPTERSAPGATRGARSYRDVSLRPCETYAEYLECVAIQKETWGADFTECVPAAILMVGQKIGGVTAGAFAPDGRLVGFVFGLTGVLDGKPAHWSDMLAVRDAARGHGLGLRLKLYQRELLLDQGVETCYWTFDPLVARNAHLNLNRLGAEIAEYVRDLYGEDTGSELHSGLGTDRFVVAWHLRSPRVEAALAGRPRDAAPFRGTPAATSGTLPDADGVRVEIPADIQEVKAGSRERARRWRETTRRAFLHYLGLGYRVDALLRDEEGRVFYGLTRGG